LLSIEGIRNGGIKNSLPSLKQFFAKIVTIEPTREFRRT